MYSGKGIKCYEPHVHRDYIVENNTVRVKPCNIFYDALDNSTPEEIIEQHSKGIWPTGCVACKHNEESGIKSRRTQMNESAHDNNIDHKAGVQNISLRYGTLCNLRCPICDPERSSAWANELVKHDIEVEERFLYDKSKMPSVEEVLKDINPAKIRKWHFHGGEPLLSDYPWEVLKISDPTAQFTFNTNGTVFPEKLKLFAGKRVEMLFSVDDIDERFEYLRYPAKFNVVEKNIAKAKDMGFSVSVTPTVSSINVWYMPEFIPWAVKTFGSRIFIEFVEMPTHFNLSHLPKYTKNRLIEKLSDKKISKFTKPIIDKVLEEKDTINFLPYLKSMDQRRNNSFSATFEEWSDIYADALHRKS